jgi:hypothetical protein
MPRLRPLLFLLAIAGCNSAESAVDTRTIQSVTLDANHQAVITTRIVPIGGGTGIDFAVYPVDLTCDLTTDFIMSDAPLITGPGSVPELDPSSNWLCLKGGTTQILVDISTLPYPKLGNDGANWAGKVRAFVSSTQSGAFLGVSGRVSCESDFGYYDRSDAQSCAQSAPLVRLDAPGTTYTTCAFGSSTCAPYSVSTCDASGDSQIESCSPGTIGEWCGSLSSTCTGGCDCQIGLRCLNSRCVRWISPHP